MRIHRHGTGLTVLELMVTLAVGAVLLSLAVPSFETFVNRQRMKAAVGSLHIDLLAARSQAVYRRGIVVACPGNPDGGCSGNADWSDGWIVFEDENNDRQRQPDETLIRRGHGHANVAIRAPASRTEIRFFPDGSSPGSNGSIGLCGRGGPAKARRLVISNIGRIRRDTYPQLDPALCPS
jgi:type IV fimbrial biogenesis protein FimT